MFATTLPTLPRGGGVGLKPEHFRTILDTRPAIGFFEVHAENYMVAGGPFHHYLERIRADYPLSIHGVGLSIGGAGPLDEAHLDRLAMLLDRYQPESFSEHLAWSSHGGAFLNDLLPVPYHRATLDRVCAHIDRVQSRLKRVMLLENPATYVEFGSSTMSETDFIGAVLRRTGCGLLLDVNNVHVACTNHGRDPYAYIRALPLETVGEIHLAGFARDMDAAGDPLLIDSHGAPVAQVVWDLYRYTLGLTGPMATLIERDNDIPAFAVLLAEAQTAERIMASLTRHMSDAVPVVRQEDFAAALLDMEGAFPPDLITWNRSDPGKRFAVYRNNVAISLIDALADTYPVVQQLVGVDFFRAMARAYARAQPPTSPVMAHYGADFAEFVAGFPPVAALPYLADVARLEWLRVEAWHAADAVSMPMDELAAVLADAQALPVARFELHPAVRVLRSTHPVVSLWAAHQTDDPDSAVAAVDLGRAEAALLLRPALDVDIVRVERPVTDFVARLQAGVALGAAVDAGEAFDLPAALGLLIRSGAIVRITTTRSSL